jgi:hypothetical protein
LFTISRPQFTSLPSGADGFTGKATISTPSAYVVVMSVESPYLVARL